MKRLLVTTLLLITAALSALAVPAWPGKFRYTQPDGSVITLQRHGDEYFNWTTDAAGRVVERNVDGYWEEVPETTFLARKARAKASAPRPRAWSTYETRPETNLGDRKILCLIANFSDSTFVIDSPREAFTRMLNQEGYSEGGAIGSVRDYYIDNSLGQYRPEFDVYGPVTLTGSSGHYDSVGVKTAILEAYELLASEIPIDDYDTDGDGDVDMVLFYFPGHNEAEGADSEAIWPHQSSGHFGMMGGKEFNRYFCTSELQGNRGNTMCAIGTTCHEFAHSLGLPDFYDTDYETNGSNADPIGKYDLMDRGNYNDSGRKPPYMNAVERNMLGWMENLAQLPSGEVTMGPVRGNTAYECQSAVEGEYFVLEVRDDYKWDTAVGDYGLVVYHIDKSERAVYGAVTGKTIWNTNRINAYGGRPCFFIEPASAGYHKAYPGTTPVTAASLNDLDGGETALLAGISFDGGNVSFRSVLMTSKTIYGTVRNSFGAPVEGARVVFSRAAYPFRAPSLLPDDTVFVTGADGYFELSLSDGDPEQQVLSVSRAGYTPVSVNVTANGVFEKVDVVLPRLGEGGHSTLYRYDSSLTLYNTRMSRETYAVSFCYPEAEIEDLGLAGYLIESVSFLVSPTSFEKAYVIITKGTEKLLLKDISDSFNPGSTTKVDVSSDGVTVPSEGDLYIGFGLTGNPTGEYNLQMYGQQESFTHGTYASSTYLEETMKWSKLSFSGSFFSFVISAEISEPRPETFRDYGIASIDASSDIPVAVASADKTVYSEEWFLDGEALAGAPALSSLSAGAHTIMLRLTYYDGTVERVYIEREIQ